MPHPEQSESMTSRERRERRAFELLTDRERSVVGLLVEGYGPKETATKLGVSSRTVLNVLQHVRAKFGVHTTVEVALVALGHLDLGARHA